MSSPEFAGWLAYDSIEPIGPIRGDLQAAMIIAKIHNVNRGKGQPRKKPSDFMPIQEYQDARRRRLKPGRPRQSHDEMRLALRQLMANQNAQVAAQKQRKKRKRRK